jgi:hypothetical protein
MVIAGILGRIGGAGKSGQWYDCLLDTKWRDIGCALVFVFAAGTLLDWAGPWWAYVLTFLLTFGSFCTYWDSVFGYDNLGFSGFVVGLAAFPLLFIDHSIWPILVVRAWVLATIWHALNVHLPERVLCWRRDVVEEFLRYAVAL